MQIIFKVVKNLLFCSMLLFLGGCSTLRIVGVLKDGTIKGLNPAQQVLISFSSHGRLIIIQAHLRGLSRPLWFLLDTGAGMCVIDSTIASELNLKPVAKIRKNGFDNRPSVSTMVVLPTLFIDSISADRIGAVLMNLYKLSLESGTKIDGILGNNFLNHFVLTISYGSHTVSLSRHNAAFADNCGVTLKMSSSLTTSLLPIMTDTAQHSSQLKLYFDSGMNGWMHVPSSWIRKNRFDSSHMISSKGIVGHASDGGVCARLYRLDSIRLGSLVLRNIPVLISDFPFAPLGQKIMAEFNIIFDYLGKRIAIVPLDQSGRSLNFSSFPQGTGLVIERSQNSSIRVCGIWKNSPADSAQIEIGDEILSVDGQIVQSVEPLRLKELIEEGGEGTEIEIIIKRAESGEMQCMKVPVRNYLR